jgi:hypothetical protein
LHDWLATDANNENVLLKEELKKLKRQMKDEQDASVRLRLQPIRRKASSVNPSRIYWVRFMEHGFSLALPSFFYIPN